MDFTPTQVRILEVLKDGMPHRPNELRDCLNDEACVQSNLRAHLTFLRKKLRRMGQDIICECGQGRRMFYRQVRNLLPPNE